MRDEGKAYEPVLNTALGEVLRRAIPIWSEPDQREEVLAEVRRVLVGGKRADVLICDPKRKPIAVETSFDAADAERDAQARIGLTLRSTGLEIETAIAIHWEEEWSHLTTPEAARQALCSGQAMHYAVYERKADGATVATRWPTAGWIETGVDALAANLWAVGTSQAEMTKLSQDVAELLRQAAQRLKEKCSRNVQQKIARRMDQQGVLHALRTAAVMWLNGMLGHEAIARAREEIGDTPPIPTIGDCTKRGKLDPRELAAAWDLILGINYEAIFQPSLEALRIATDEDYEATTWALEKVREAKDTIDGSRVGSTLNVGGELLPELSESRKETAAFYTRPVVAEMLAQIAIDKALPERGRIADLACGTGTLCRAAYRRLRELEPGTDRDEFHRRMMETGVRALDISRMAAHLTASSLTMMNPKVDYPQCQIGVAPVGRPNRTGSIELLEAISIGRVLADEGGEITRRGDGTASRDVTVQHAGIHYVIQNPPYSRPRGGRKGYDLKGLSEKERQACIRRQRKLDSEDGGRRPSRNGSDLRIARAEEGCKPGRPGNGAAHQHQRRPVMGGDTQGAGGEVQHAGNGHRRGRSMARQLVLREHGAGRDIADWTPRRAGRARGKARHADRVTTYDTRGEGGRTADPRAGPGRRCSTAGSADVGGATHGALDRGTTRGRGSVGKRRSSKRGLRTGCGTAPLRANRAGRRLWTHGHPMRDDDTEGAAGYGGPATTASGTSGGEIREARSRCGSGWRETRATSRCGARMGPSSGQWNACQATPVGSHRTRSTARQAQRRYERSVAEYCSGGNSGSARPAWERLGRPGLCTEAEGGRADRMRTSAWRRHAHCGATAPSGSSSTGRTASAQDPGRSTMQWEQTLRQPIPALDRIGDAALTQAAATFGTLKEIKLKAASQAEHDPVRKDIDKAVIEMLWNDARERRRVSETIQRRAHQLGLEPHVQGAPRKRGKGEV